MLRILSHQNDFKTKLILDFFKHFLGSPCGEDVQSQANFTCTRKESES